MAMIARVEPGPDQDDILGTAREHPLRFGAAGRRSLSDRDPARLQEGPDPGEHPGGTVDSIDRKEHHARDFAIRRPRRYRFIGSGMLQGFQLFTS